LDLCLNFHLVSLLSTLHKKWECKNAVGTTILSHVEVTIDGILDWWIDLLTTYARHLELQVITALSLISTLYKSLAHANSFQSVTVSTSHFLAVDFNTGTATVSLNYALQLSHMKSSFHSRTLATHFFTVSHTELHQADWTTQIVLSHSQINYFTQLNWTAGLRSSPWGRPKRKHCSPIVCLFISVGMCSPSHCLETGCITRLFCCCWPYLATSTVYRVTA
jgi:hypothetical protein